MGMIASTVTLLIIHSGRMVRMARRIPSLELWKLIVLNFVALRRLRRGASAGNRSTVVKGARFQSHVLTFCDLFFDHITSIILFYFPIHAEIVLLERDKRKVELLLDAKALQQIQIALCQSVHDLLLVLILLVFVTVSLLQQIDPVQGILVPPCRRLYLNLRKVEQLFIPEGIVYDRDVLNNGAHFIAKVIILLPTTLDYARCYRPPNLLDPRLL